MNIEEKAKAYDNIIQRVTELYETGTILTKEQMEHLFPELRESENERIRKYLIGELKTAKSVGELKFTIPQPTREECIAYLEKQKEQKPAEWSEKDERIRQGLIKMYKNEHLVSVPIGVHAKDIIRFLENLRPSWKPSEEQMEALNAMNCYGELSYQGQQQLLIDLYQQLKKL